jgi:hypothetical protein
MGIGCTGFRGADLGSGRAAVQKTPDRQVQQAIGNVFQKFHQLGSARQATIWFREEQIALPLAKLGTAGKEVY